MYKRQEQRDGDEVRARVAVRAEEAEEYRPAQTHVREVEEYPAREHDEEQVDVRQDVQLFKEPLEEKTLYEDENEEIEPPEDEIPVRPVPELSLIHISWATATTPSSTSSSEVRE